MTPRLTSREGAELFRSDSHTGAVGGLDFNPFQNNLLASAAGNGEASSGGRSFRDKRGLTDGR